MSILNPNKIYLVGNKLKSYSKTISRVNDYRKTYILLKNFLLKQYETFNKHLLNVSDDLIKNSSTPTSQHIP